MLRDFSPSPCRAGFVAEMDVTGGQTRSSEYHKYYKILSINLHLEDFLLFLLLEVDFEQKTIKKNILDSEPVMLLGFILYNFLRKLV